jgi:hypothetical protein
VSIGRFARTVWELDPRQVWGRAGFRARRALWPAVDALRHVPFRLPALARRNVLPATCPLEDADLELLREGVLALSGHESALPVGPPYEPEETDPLYRYQLHEHGWLREAMTRAPDLRPRLGAWLEGYVSARFERRSVARDPYPLATRIRERQALVQLGLAAPERFAQSFADDARQLVGLSETHLLANHLLRDRAALVSGSAWVGGVWGRPLRARALAMFAAECRAQFGGDGMHEERCPSYHAHALGDVLFALEAAESFEPSGERDRWCEALRACAERALGALEVVTHADDLVAAFGDSAPRSTPRTSSFARWADALGLRSAAPAPEAAGAHRRSTLPGAGFSKVAGARYDAFVTHGPFGAPAQPGHAHCDLFAFEMDVSGQRVVVDPGVHAYHDPDARLETRRTRAHATPTLEGPQHSEQAEIWSRFRCGWRPRSIEARWHADSLVCEARAFGPHHVRTLRRTFRFAPHQLCISDEVEGASDISAAIPLAPGLTAAPSPGGAVVRDAAGRHVLEVWASRGVGLRIERAEVSHRFGARTPAQRLRLRGPGRVEYTLVAAPP